MKYRTTRITSCLSATFFTKSLTRNDAGKNLGVRGKRPVINCMIHGTAEVLYFVCIMYKYLAPISSETPYSRKTEMWEKTTKLIFYLTENTRHIIYKVNWLIDVQED
jgi:hypothetical protein